MTTPPLLPRNLGFLMPTLGDPDVGEFLVTEAVQHGSQFRSVAFTGIAYPLRVPADGRPIYENRLNADIPWSWRSCPAAEAAQREVERVEHLFDALTRVTLIIPAPRLPLLLHYDPVIGNEYQEGAPFKRHGCNVPANRLHAANRHLCMKVPITEKRGDYGVPMLRHEGVTYRYSAEGRFFLLNEIDMLHGAAPVEHHRGVLWIDGILNLPALDSLEGCDSFELLPTAEPVAVEPSCEGGPYGRD